MGHCLGRSSLPRRFVNVGRACQMDQLHQLLESIDALRPLCGCTALTSSNPQVLLWEGSGHTASLSPNYNPTITRTHKGLCARSLDRPAAPILYLPLAAGSTVVNYWASLLGSWESPLCRNSRCFLNGRKRPGVQLVYVLQYIRHRL